MFGVTGSVCRLRIFSLRHSYSDFGNWSNNFGFRHWQDLEIRMSGHKVSTPVPRSHFKVCLVHCEVGYFRLNDRDGAAVNESKVALGGGYIDAIWFMQKWQI